MIKRALTAVVVVALILVSATASASSSTTISTSPVAPEGLMSGGRYILIEQAQPVDEAPTGGRYRLAEATLVADNSGCCCKTNLPCLLK